MWKRNKGEKEIRELFEKYTRYYKIYKKGKNYVGIIPDNTLGTSLVIFGTIQDGKVENTNAIEVDIGINLLKTILDKTFKHLEVELEEIERKES